MKKKNKTLENMTVADVFKTVTFFKNVKKSIKEQKKSFIKSESKGYKIAKWAEKLVDKITPGDCIVAYAEIIDKKNISYSSNERKLIQSMCSNAYNLTIKQLIDSSDDKEKLEELIKKKNEEKRNNSTRNN